MSNFVFNTVVVFFPLIVVAQTECPNDWIAFNGSCFKIFVDASVPLPMQTARRHCYENGADLTSIHSEAENAFLWDEISQRSSNGTDTVFYIGLFADRNIGINLWADGSPVDFFGGQTNSLSPHKWNDFVHFYWPKKMEEILSDEFATNVSSMGNCVVMIANGTKWRDIRCDVPTQGFVCKKIVGQKPLNVAKISMITLSLLSIHPQCFVLWLVVVQSPEPMKTYRFYLCANTVFDILSTIAIGILMIPDLWLPYAGGCTVTGLARFLGPEGGRISICIALFAVICQVFSQLFSIIFRYASAIEHHNDWPMRLISSVQSRFVQAFVVIGTALIIVVFMFPMMDNPTDLPYWVGLYFNGITQKVFSDAMLAEYPVVNRISAMRLRVLYTLAGTFGLFFTLSIFFAICIVRHLKANSMYFSEYTFKLHYQLIITLMLQLTSPLLLIGLPILSTLFANLAISFPVFNKNVGQICILLFELYALANPLMIVCFVTPFRRYTAQHIGCNALLKRMSGEERRVEQQLNIPAPSTSLNSSLINRLIQRDR